MAHPLLNIRSTIEVKVRKLPKIILIEKGGVDAQFTKDFFINGVNLSSERR